MLNKTVLLWVRFVNGIIVELKADVYINKNIEECLKSLIFVGF